MTDLYDQAAALPRLLRGDRIAVRHDDLLAEGDRRGAIDWARRRHRLSRPFRGAYLVGCAPADLLDRLRAALLVLPPATALSHHTAAVLYGFGVVRSADVHVVVPPGAALPQRRGITTHESVLPVDGSVEVCGLPCVPPARCAADLARRLPRRDALTVLDAALRAGVCTADDLLAELARHDRLRGVRQARELVPLATPLAECRQETHARLLLHDARLPAPAPQLVVVDRWSVERHRVDLGYEEEQVGVEYDRESHADGFDGERQRRERHRHNWLVAQGWRLHYFTDAELYRRPDRLVQAVRATLFHRRSADLPRPMTGTARPAIAMAAQTPGAARDAVAVRRGAREPR